MAIPISAWLKASDSTRQYPRLNMRCSPTQPTWSVIHAVSGNGDNMISILQFLDDSQFHFGSHPRKDDLLVSAERLLPLRFVLRDVQF